MYTFNVLHKNDFPDWSEHLKKYLALMTTHYGVTKKTCCGIDFRQSAGFLRRDVGQSTIIVECSVKGEVRGFAMLKTQLRSDCLYVVLMCSLLKGVGRAIVSHVASLGCCTQRYLVLRSTDDALGFYLRLGFRLFNWQGTDGYATIGDSDITNWLSNVVEAHKPRDPIREELYRRHWIEYEDLEWPLILVRNARAESNADSVVRRSSRLLSKVEACTLRD